MEVNVHDQSPSRGTVSEHRITFSLSCRKLNKIPTYYAIALQLPRA